jgi:hypothetical protein
LENRAGVALPAQVANHVGLTGGLRRALSGVRSWRDHDPGVARDVAVTLVDGGDCVSDLAARDPELLWRAPRAGHGLAAHRLAHLGRRSRTTTSPWREWRRCWPGWGAHVWGSASGAPPVLAAGEPLCVDLDATLATAHSEKDGAAEYGQAHLRLSFRSGVRRPW